MDATSDERAKTKLKDILENDCPVELKLAIRAASDKGASSWVTAMPMFDHGTVLHKRDFVDAVCIRYGWQLRDLPTTCGCGEAMDLTHALNCKRGGLRIIQHNEVRDTIAQCMQEAGCSAVGIEPELIPLEGEEFESKSVNKQDEARSGVNCWGFWYRQRQAFFDVKVISPFAKSNLKQSPTQMSMDRGSRKSSALT